MRTIEHTVSHLIIHDLAKEPGSPARLMLRDAPCMLVAAALRRIRASPDSRFYCLKKASKACRVVSGCGGQPGI